jgi:rhamnosyltransferase
LSKSISIIIPTLNASRYIPKLFSAFDSQKYDGSVEIVIIDSSSDDGTESLVLARKDVQFTKIARTDFTHGYARNLGVKKAKGEIVVFLSQDALPYDEFWLRNLTAPLETGNTAACYSRQVPYSNATPIEAYFLKVRFPEEKKVTHPDPSKELKLFDVFFSNVSAAARRSAALETPFQEDLIMSEDQQFSRDLLKKGYSIVYEPASVVWHSHRYDLKTVFRRYFDSAYSLTCIFGQTLSESRKIGTEYLKKQAKFILTRHPHWLPYYFFYLAAQTAGTVAGHHAESLPLWMVKKLSLHRRFWDKKRN